jgi:beta-glucanase (GH16 family)
MIAAVIGEIAMFLKNPNHSWMALILVVAALPFSEEAKTQTAFNPSNPAASGYTLAFNATFTGYALETSQWNTGWAWSSGAGTNSTYPKDDAVPANISFTGGVLNLAVTKKRNPARLPYSTAVINTCGKFSQTYGYWEARVQFPASANGAANGIWPAFWLVPTDFSWPPEIDIMEWLGVQTTTDYMTLHYGPASAPLSADGFFTGTNLSSGFHTLGMLWTPASITWYVDGVQEFRTTVGIPTTQMYIILNNDTGGWNGNVVNSRTVFPAILKVSYVHVFAPP